MIAQYPFYMNDANRSSLIEATRMETRTIIRNNTITSSVPLYLFYLKGVQRVEKNRLYSPSAWWDSSDGGEICSSSQYGTDSDIFAFGFPKRTRARKHRVFVF